MADFVMPLLGADMEKATLIRWLVQPGDQVKRGDLMAEVDTEKAAMEIEVFEDGAVAELVAKPGDVVPVGGLMARIRGAAAATPIAGAAAPAPAVDTHPATAAAVEIEERRVTPAARARAEQLGIEPLAVTGTGIGGAVTRRDVDAAAAGEARPAPERPPEPERVRISPRARRVAAELGIDPAGIAGSGPDGSVVEEDVRRAASAPATPGPISEAARPGEPARTAARKRAIGALMARSKRDVPHYYLGTTVDLKRALDWLAQENRARAIGERMLPIALVIKAVALATRAVPGVNGAWTDDGFVPGEHAHVGIAISLRDGSLLAPALLNADALALSELMGALRDLVNRARNGLARATEMSNATITVTNLGDQGVEWVHPVIFAPQVAIVGVGKVTEQPWAENGMLGIRPVVKLTLSGDHRASSGHEGARFLAEVARLLQTPEKL